MTEGEPQRKAVCGGRPHHNCCGVIHGNVMHCCLAVVLTLQSTQIACLMIAINPTTSSAISDIKVQPTAVSIPSGIGKALNLTRIEFVKLSHVSILVRRAPTWGPTLSTV
jgi:hypothetical protein